jgi:hypothetical protein
LLVSNDIGHRQRLARVDLRQAPYWRCTHGIYGAANQLETAVPIGAVTFASAHHPEFSQNMAAGSAFVL